MVNVITYIYFEEISYERVSDSHNTIVSNKKLYNSGCKIVGVENRHY